MLEELQCTINHKEYKDEIKTVLKGEDFDENELNEFIKKFDLNGDGQINYYEFLSNMTEIK